MPATKGFGNLSIPCCLGEVLSALPAPVPVIISWKNRLYRSGKSHKDIGVQSQQSWFVRGII